jgi:hypothetical protein
MLTDMKQDRQQLVTQANAAETPDQIKVATVALKRWQASNPNDPEINTARTISYEGGLAQDKARMVIGPRLLFGLKLYLFQKGTSLLKNSSLRVEVRTGGAFGYAL